MPRKKKDADSTDVSAGTPAKKTTRKTKAKKAAKPAVGRMAQLAGVVDKVFKDGAGRVELDMAVLTKPHPHTPTGSIIIDYLVGGQPNDNGVPPCPGLPKGRLFNLYGMESSGKTTLALTTAATTIANGGRVCFIDWEHAIDLRYAKALGVPQDPDKYLAQPTTLETGMGILYAMAKGGVELIIIDSVGAGVPKKIMEQKLDEVGEIGRVGLLSAKWGAFLPKLKEAIAKSGSTVIGISQLRDKINTGGGGFKGPTKHAQGGNSWKFYSELRIMLRRTKSEKGKVFSALENKWIEGIVGNVVEARIDKCKVAPTQGAKATFFIRFGEGIDDVRSIIEIAMAHGIVHKAGSWITWDRGNPHGEMKTQGIDKFRTELLRAPGAWEDLYKRTFSQMSDVAAGATAADDEDDIDDLDLGEIGFLTGE
jgi:recombination protein RecA